MHMDTNNEMLGASFNQRSDRPVGVEPARREPGARAVEVPVFEGTQRPG